MITVTGISTTPPFCFFPVQVRFGGKLILTTGFATTTSRDEVAQLLTAADAVAVGRALIANPDLVERRQGDHSENEPRRELFYAHTAEGYTDYPFLQAN